MNKITIYKRGYKRLLSKLKGWIKKDKLKKINYFRWCKTVRQSQIYDKLDDKFSKDCTTKFLRQEGR